MNRELITTRPHPSKQISDAITRTPTIINLTLGEPVYQPPNLVSETIRTLLTEQQHEEVPLPYNRYAHSYGTASLRQAIAERYRRLYALDIDPDTQILVTNGAAEAIWLTIFTLTNPGDEIIIPDPCYMLYELVATSLGRSPVRLATSVNQGFRLDPDALEQLVSPRTRLLLLNSPENPTGAVYDYETLYEITALAHKYGFYIMHDEVFDSVVYTGEHIPALLLDPNATQTIMVNSVSKRYGMTGWRLGWLVAAERVVAEAAKAHTYVNLAITTLIQEAVTAILNDLHIDQEVMRRVIALREKGSDILQELVNIGGFTFPSGKPAGGFYLFPCVNELYKALDLSTNSFDIVGDVVAQYLLDTCKVAVVPGSRFGPSGNSHIRISFVGSSTQLDTALDRFRQVLQRA